MSSLCLQTRWRRQRGEPETLMTKNSTLLAKVIAALASASAVISLALAESWIPQGITLGVTSTYWAVISGCLFVMAVTTYAFEVA